MRHIIVGLCLVLALGTSAWAEPLDPRYDFTNDTVFAAWQLDGTPQIAAQRFLLVRLGKTPIADCRGEAVWEQVARPLFDLESAELRQLAIIVTRQHPGTCEVSLDYVAVDAGFADTGMPSGQWTILHGDVEAVARLLSAKIAQGMRLAMLATRL
jgi:hypothetical protein